MSTEIDAAREQGSQRQLHIDHRPAIPTRSGIAHWRTLRDWP
ncbi:MULTISPECIES: hypothetical protein [unclassified Moorena]|nr:MULTISPECIES: hypothetical protein [unclassified Moorena]